MEKFLESLFGASWRTSLFACVAVACTALASCDLSPMVSKIAMAGAAVSTAIGLFLARDNKVSSSQVAGNGGLKAGPTFDNTAKVLLLFLLPALMFSGGCNKLVKWDSATDKHVRATQADNVRHWQKCSAGDSNECATCLAVTLAEMQYIKDNNSVKMDADFKARFDLMQAQLLWLMDDCGKGNPKACYAGAKTGINYLGVVISAVDDVNANPRKY